MPPDRSGGASHVLEINLNASGSPPDRRVPRAVGLRQVQLVRRQLGGEDQGRSDHQDRDQPVLRQDEGGGAEGSGRGRRDPADGGGQVRRGQRQPGHRDREHGGGGRER